MYNLLDKYLNPFRDADGTGNGNPADDASGANGDGSKFDFAKLTAELDGDTREWLSKRNFGEGEKVVAGLAKHAYEQDKLIGSSVRIPKDDAPQEERDAFLNKLGRPAEAKDYEFTMPEDLPEALPYDGERAAAFKDFAHSIGLSKTQAAAMHDWYVKNAVEDFNVTTADMASRDEELAVAETAKLVRRWGPLDGETAKANIQFADQFIEAVGGENLINSLKAHKLVGPNKEILDENIAVAFATAGAALFKEGEVLRGDQGDLLGNPFADGEGNNTTRQMQLVNSDPDKARALIAAAGKTPKDFGLQNRLK